MSRNNRYMTVKELAYSQGVDAQTVRRWMRRGYLDVRRLAPKTLVRVRLSRLERTRR